MGLILFQKKMLKKNQTFIYAIRTPFGNRNVNTQGTIIFSRRSIDAGWQPFVPMHGFTLYGCQLASWLPVVEVVVVLFVYFTEKY